jgi:glycosyltransferase 2 family protein
MAVQRYYKSIKIAPFNKISPHHPNSTTLNQRLKQTLQILVFLAIGATVFYWLYKDQDWEKMKTILSAIDARWIWLSLFFGLISHWARAMRWKMLIGAAGSNVKWYNAVMAVFTGYLANLVLPRMGEVTRCGVLTKYNKVPFATLAGTVVAERLTDLVALLLVIASSFVMEYDILAKFLADKISFVWIIDLFMSVWWWLFIVLIVVAVIYIRRRVVQMAVFRKFKTIWGNFMEGFRAIKTMKNKHFYLFYSLLIWGMYFLMQYTSFFAIAETSGLTPVAGWVLLATGSIGMLAPVQGGVGTWHAMVIATLALYGVTNEPAGAYALLLHGAQNLMIAVIGLVALVLFPLVNPNYNRQID